MEHYFGRRSGCSLCRYIAPHPRHICGQPDGSGCARRAALGLDQRDRIPVGFRPDAGVERRADARTFSSAGRLGSYGAALDLINQGLNDLSERTLSPEPVSRLRVPSVTKRIVILGGGFGGMRTAECLEEQLRADPSVSLTL